MEAISQRIQTIPPEQVGGVVELAFQKIFEHVPINQVRENADSMAEVSILARLESDTLKRDFEQEEGAHFGRVVLEYLAGEPALSPLVDEAITEVQDSDLLVVETLLAVGFVVNLTLLVATTEIEVETGSDGKTRWKFRKGVASTELVKSLVDPLTKFLKPGGD